MSERKTVKLGDLFDFKNGLNKGVEYFGHGTPIVNYMDVNKNNFLTKDSVKGLVQVTKSELSNCGARKGDVFFTRTSETLDEIGLSSVLVDHIDSCVFSGYILRARPKTDELIPKYCAYSLRVPSIRKKIMRKSSMTTRALTNGRFLSDVDFSYPGKDEQERIVSILEAWNAYLEKLDKKIELKQSIHDGLLFDLLGGKKRLPNFDVQWSQHKLGEVAKIEKGKALTSNGLVAGDIPVIAGGKTSPYSHNSHTHENVITVSASGAYAGYVSYHSYKIWASDCSVVQGSVGVSITEYIYYYLKHQQKQIYLLQSGGAQPHIYPADLKALKISLPSLKEQVAITDLLTASNDELVALRKYKQLLNEQKQYLVNNLISGKIRTEEVRHA